MSHHRRLPSIAVLVVFGIGALLYARPWKSAGTAGGTSLSQLELTITAGDATKETWLAYGQALFEAGQFGRAAMAYEKVLEAEPYHRPARFQRAVALAKSGDGESLLAYLGAQVHVEPKLVAELLDRAELQSFLTDNRFATLAKEARSQAMD